MKIPDAVALTTGVQSLRATAGAVLGAPGGLFAGPAETFDAVLTIDDDASVSGELLTPGASHRAVVTAGPDRPGSQPRMLCLKVPDAYGAGRDQDFLLASSGDGAPLHHAVLPAAPVAPLYSSLWLYLAGWEPVLFGVCPPVTGHDVRFGVGDELGFMVSPPVGRFRRVGAVKLTGVAEGRPPFSGANSGGGIRALPPVLFY
ncbi:hypothetical protein CRI77_23775 [Mycolicibacterium duvalii]|uniref:Uncharacterized protein n=1 Tax=Mycolicibacterium duvalii TaxID=39688 RepID=A0A7I7K755_9MYCO|nr:hypothetical protein [Mycolicibacterium duvalii]MCV7370688.1 hypothetical protein [Mycolicibacterium duvalii]PEG36081.1 hypothetical protein CRI77_23775 [Mycolicibacterium duvalii]BBX19359.1 hypothetical protein MDUV_42190 [Mycolicibacterium duvalii]